MEKAVMTTDKPYSFRRLNSSDAFLMMKIISRIGVNEFAKCFDRDTIIKLMSDAKGTEKVDLVSLIGVNVAFDLVDVICTNVPKCENEIFQLLGRVSGMKPEEIRRLDFAVFTEMLVDFVKKEEFADFIRVVSRSFK